MVSEWIKLVERQSQICQTELFYRGEFYARSLEYQTFGEAFQAAALLIQSLPGMSYLIVCVSGVPL